MCLSVLREEFRLAQFRLQHFNSADFAESPVSFTLSHRSGLGWLVYGAYSCLLFYRLRCPWTDSTDRNAIPSAMQSFKSVKMQGCFIHFLTHMIIRCFVCLLSLLNKYYNCRSSSLYIEAHRSSSLLCLIMRMIQIRFIGCLWET